MSNSVYYKATDEDGNTVLKHSWKNHKYIRIENGRYIYPEDEAAQKNAETIKEIGKSINYISTSNYMKIAAAFESAEELNEEAKQFSKSAENF